MLLDALAEVLRTPAFPEEELDKEKKRLVGSIRQQQDQPSVRAYEGRCARIYPPAHPLHRLTGEERIARVEALTREDLARFYAASATARPRSSLVVVGDVEAERILDRLEAAFGVLAGRVPPPQIAAPPAPAAVARRRRPSGCPTRRAPTSSSRCPRT